MAIVAVHYKGPKYCESSLLLKQEKATGRALATRLPPTSSSMPWMPEAYVHDVCLQYSPSGQCSTREGMLGLWVHGPKVRTAQALLV